jgi:methyltransferase (TIGR00027 family)
MPIRNISDTALWVAMYRAFESERSDALFHDPYARRMAGERGNQIVREIPFGQAIGWSMVVRTVLMDEIILRCVAQGARCVVNLGAGLDTRAFRLELPADLCWFDLDLPEMVAHRRACLKGETPTCNHTDIAVDLSDGTARKRVLASVHTSGDPVLLITEGLLVYLAPEQVASLARQIHAERLARWWVTDLVTPWLALSLGALWQSPLEAAGAPFRFAPFNGAEFFQPLGWREAEFRSIWDESLRLQRSAPMAWWWGFFGMPFFAGVPEGLRRTASVTLLERNN